MIARNLRKVPAVIAVAFAASCTVASPAFAVDCVVTPDDPACVVASPTPTPTLTPAPAPAPTTSASSTSTTTVEVSPGPYYGVVTLDERQYWAVLILITLSTGLTLASFIFQHSWPKGMDT